MRKWLISGLIVLTVAAVTPAVTLALSHANDQPQERPPIVEPEPPFDCDDLQTLWACGDQMAALAKLDLSNRLILPLSAIAVLRVEKVNWPDASLGLPAPPALYAQVITPGYKVIVEAQGRRYVYHIDSLNRVVLAQR
ncbi:MAG: hypothetical protein FJ039_03395 [Chloroflexi bacterium]|nr:hypothetical protein [Chloroflexota bacterium]